MSLVDRANARRKAIEHFYDNINMYVLEAVRQYEHVILDMNADQQLFQQGINRLGVSIWDYAPYHPITIQMKQAEGLPANRVTLFQEGDFYESMFIEYGADEFTISAGDYKTTKLKNKYGAQILGLTQENITTLRDEYIMPYMRDKLRELIDQAV